MKIRIVTTLLVSWLTCGCGKKIAQEDLSGGPRMISVAAFKLKDATKQPNPAELAALKAYASTLYNPRSNPQIIDNKGLEDSGFQLLVSGFFPIEEGVNEQVFFSQGLPSSEENMRLQVARKKTSGGSEIHAKIGDGEQLIPSDKNFAGYEDVGTHLFNNGVAIAWISSPSAR